MSFPIYDIAARRAELHPAGLAMVDLASGERVSYGDLHQRAGRAAALLAAMGAGRGERVAVLCRNRIEFFELLFACARLGAIMVPLNWRMPAAELRPLLQDCGARLLIHGSEDADAAHDLAADGPTLLDLDEAGSGGYRARRDAQSALDGRGSWMADETWYLLYTSGTTGVPKGVIQTYGMALANYVNVTQAMGLRGEDTTLCYLPLFHAGGISLTALPALIRGATVLVTPGFDCDQVVELLEAGRLDTFFGVPAIYQAISLHPRFAHMDFSRVRCWGCGGAPLPDSLFTAFAQRGATVLNGMGMTETGPTVFLMDPHNAHRKIGSVGKPQLLAAVRIVDADGRDVARGETGELWFAGLGITPGYFNRPDATAEALTEDGWLRSGDLGRQDEDGYYYVVGRLKEMYISGGENVYPAEIENQLAQHPDILEAAVVGRPDERWGEVGCAYLLARPGHPSPPPEELTGFLRQRLAAYKVPRQFIVVEEFPRTAAGKVQKHLLLRREVAP
ncbi:MAG: AMP-binding protein [Lysobacterales bacterium]